MGCFANDSESTNNDDGSDLVTGSMVDDSQEGSPTVIDVIGWFLTSSIKVSIEYHRIS